jgi:hypothetical protein
MLARNITPETIYRKKHSSKPEIYPAGVDFGHLIHQSPASRQSDRRRNPFLKAKTRRLGNCLVFGGRVRYHRDKRYVTPYTIPIESVATTTMISRTAKIT